jgi:hypothetical protein
VTVLQPEDPSAPALFSVAPLPLPQGANESRVGGCANWWVGGWGREGEGDEER